MSKFEEVFYLMIATINAQLSKWFMFYNLNHFFFNSEDTKFEIQSFSKNALIISKPRKTKAQQKIKHADLKASNSESDKKVCRVRLNLK